MGNPYGNLGKEEWLRRRELLEHGLKVCNGPLCKGAAQPLSAFSKNRSHWTGRASVCKACHSVIDQTPKRKRQKCEAAIRWSKTPKGREAHEQARKAGILSNSTKKFWQTERGQECRNQANENYRRSGKASAKAAVANAVSRGRIAPIHTRRCVDCDEQAQHYHHPDYTKPLEVIPLCAKCHKLRHLEMK